MKKVATWLHRCFLFAFLTFSPLSLFAFSPFSVLAQQANDLNAAARASLDRAIAALQANRVVEAERAARAAVTSAPRSPVTHNLLGVILDRTNRSDEAQAEFNAALKLDPNFVSAHNNLGRLLAQRGQVKEAIAEFEFVLKS